MVKKKENTDFDYSTIPSYVQYDVIPLPSKGECYPHKIDRVPVAYLTAADENIITSPNMYRDNKVVDSILSRKILDKRINPMDLTQGDRDAIILWLRETGYGVDFPISIRNPKTGNAVESTIDLSTLTYKDFRLKGDENGFFEYKTKEGKGDAIKFKFLTKREENEFYEENKKNGVAIDKVDIIGSIEKMKLIIEKGNIDEEHTELLNDYLADLKKIADDIEDSDVEDEEYVHSLITNSMIARTMSINGNDDRDFIKTYIENMRVKESKAFRDYMQNNTPGVNLEVEIELPESDGGGSYKTFLTIGETVFINI